MPDGSGSYANGSWSRLADSNQDRLYFASAVLADEPGGEGYISVFQQKDPDHYELIAKIPSALEPVLPRILESSSNPGV